jgi:RNA polymerase sigma factor (TIGR02999 family)
LRAEIRDRQHFFGLAGRAMRQVLVDHARKVNAKKRGDGGAVQRPEEAIQGGSDLAPETLLAIHAGLDELHKLDPVSARVVDLKYFLGCSWEETAEIMEMNVPAARRNWEFARAFLAQRMS